VVKKELNMPKVLVTPAAGLFQEAGDGTLSGHKKEVKILTTSTTLTLADSGKIIVLGGAGTVQFPVSAGWNAEFYLTGASAAVVSGSALSSATAVTVQGRELGTDGTTDAVAIDAGVGATFAVGTSVAGDSVCVNVLSTSRIQMDAKVST